jgi:hypothetical protein
LVLALVGMGVAGTIVLEVGRRIDKSEHTSNWTFQAVVLSGVFGLIGYVYYGLGLPGSAVVDGISPGLRGLLIGFAWGFLPPIVMLPLLRRTATHRIEDTS